MSRYRDKIYWVLGDTNQFRIRWELITSPEPPRSAPADGGLDPATGVNLDYFKGDDWFCQASRQGIRGRGPTVDSLHRRLERIEAAGENGCSLATKRFAAAWRFEREYL